MRHQLTAATAFACGLLVGCQAEPERWHGPYQVCVIGAPAGAVTRLRAGDPLRVRVSPMGIWDCNCSEVVEASCEVNSSGTTHVVEPTYRTRPTGGPCTVQLCIGGPNADCLGPSLAEGDHTVKLGDASVTFTVPGRHDPNDLCAQLDFY